MGPQITPQSEHPDTSALVQLHIAEYQALTNRCTYRIYFQFSVWGLILVYLPLIVLSWNSIDHALIVWLTGLIVLGGCAIWQSNLIEIYRAIHYIESVLRPRIERLVPGTEFWGYERYLAHGRSTLPTWWEYLFHALGFVVVALLGLFRYHEARAVAGWRHDIWKDVFGVALNLAVLVLLIRSTKEAVELRNKWFAGDVTEKTPEPQKTGLV